MVKNDLKSIEARLKKAQEDLKQKERAFRQAKTKLFAEFGELKLRELELQNPEKDYDIESLIEEQKRKNKQIEKEIEEEKELAELEMESELSN